MPNFDRLHNLASKLSKLTAPGQQEPGLASWCLMTGETWKQIAEIWEEQPKQAAAEDLYAALEAMECGQCGDRLDELPYDPSLPCVMCQPARAALAKARGEQT